MEHPAPRTSVLLRRVATSVIPVAGGVAVLTDAVPRSHWHNQLLIDEPVNPEQLVADAESVLGGAGLNHRMAYLIGDHMAATAAAIVELGWTCEPLVIMAAPAGGESSAVVEQVDLEELRPYWNASWRHDAPDMDDDTITQLIDRYRLEEAVCDLRYLAVRQDGRVAACCLMRIDGTTAEVDAVGTDHAFRGRGYGDALVSTALALARDSGCDHVVLEAAVDDWPRAWYARRGFAEVSRNWSVSRP